MINVKPLKLDSKENNIFFTSDLHFGHNNILKFCNRPWETTEEMDEALINNWNSVVKQGDIVFNLGDFAFASNGRWKEILSQLNGNHYLILGNHDILRYPGDYIMSFFDCVEHQMLINIDGRYIYLNHYPFLCYGGTYRNPDYAVWNLHGHVHSGPNNHNKDTDRLALRFPFQYDVGVDNNDYKPISYNDLKVKIESQVKAASILSNSLE